jgi:hypothetical protein
MCRHELNRAVAHATGETVDAIQRRGFHVLDDSESVSGPRVFDWDADEPVLVGDVLTNEDDCPRHVDALPSYDEEQDEYSDLALL